MTYFSATLRRSTSLRADIGCATLHDGLPPDLRFASRWIMTRHDSSPKKIKKSPTSTERRLPSHFLPMALAGRLPVVIAT